MSKIVMNGFRTDASLEDIDALLLKNILWYDSVKNQIKVGNKVLNYYIDETLPADDIYSKRVLTTLTQAEAPTKTIFPLEFNVLLA